MNALEPIALQASIDENSLTTVEYDISGVELDSEKLSTLFNTDGVVATAIRYALEKMILINSYVKGKARVVDISKNTHIAGRNGKGKTSLLRLIPIFFGESPSKMVRPTGDVMKSLREYIFDSPSSYLVFEYINFDGPKLAIVFYGSKDTPSYIICDGVYDPNLFLENGSYVESRVLNGRLKTFKRNPTRTLALNEFQTIIQRIGSRAVSGEIRGYMNRFSLSEKGSLAGLEKIASGMFFKNTNFSSLKRMAYSVMAGSEESDISTSMPQTLMQLFFENFKSYHAVMRHASDFLETRDAHQRFKIAKVATQQTGIQANILSNYLSECLTEIRQHIKDAEERISEEKRNHLESSMVLDSQIRVMGSDIENSRKIVKHVDNEQTEFENSDIENCRELVRSLTQVEERIKSLQSSLEALEESSGNINQKYEVQTLLIKEKSHDRIRPLQGQLEMIASEASEKSHELADAITKERETLATTLETSEEKIRVALGVANDTLVELNRVAAGISASQDHQQKIELANTKKETILNEILSLTSLQNEISRELAGEISNFRDLESRLKHEEEMIIKKKNERDRLKKLHSPDTNALLHFVRENKPESVTQFCQVINEELLGRTDLQPSVVDEESLALYGIRIDTSKISSSIASREKLLVEDIANLEDEISDVTRKSESLRNDLGKIDIKRAAATKRRDEVETQANIKKRLLDDATAQISAAKVDAEQDVKQRKLVAENNVFSAEDTKTRLVKQQQEARKQKKERTTALEINFTHRNHEIESSKVREMSSIKGLVLSEEKETKETLSALEESRLTELRLGGVDVNGINRINHQIKEDELKVKIAKNTKEFVEKYDRWLTSRPEDRRLAKQEIQRLEGLLIDLQTEKNDKEKEAVDYIESVERTVFGDRLREGSMDEKLIKINKFRNYNNTEPLGVEAIEPFEPIGVTLENLSVQYAKHQDEAKKLKNKRLKNIQIIHSEFIKASPKTHVSQVVRTMPVSIIDSDMESNLDEIIETMANWYVGGHEQSRDAINMECKSVCSQFLTYHSTLQTFRESVQRLSSELQKNLDADMVFDSIKSVKMFMSCRVERLSYWNELTGVVNEYKRWQESNNATGLPPKELHCQLDFMNQKIVGGKLVESPESLIEMEIRVDDGQGKEKTITTEDELKNASSSGLSQMIMALVFVSFVNRVRKDKNVWLTWAIDELGAIDKGNAVALIKMLNKNSITLVTAEPEGEAKTLSLFENHYEVLPDFELQRTKLEKTRSHHVKRHHAGN